MDTNPLPSPPRSESGHCRNAAVTIRRGPPPFSEHTTSRCTSSRFYIAHYSGRTITLRECVGNLRAAINLQFLQEAKRDCVSNGCQCPTMSHTDVPDLTLSKSMKE